MKKAIAILMSLAMIFGSNSISAMAASKEEVVESPAVETAVEDDVIEEVNEDGTITFTDATGYSINYTAGDPSEYECTVSSNGVLMSITKNGEPVEGNVVIPENKGITDIGNVFEGNTRITYVKVPQGVTTVSANAFKGCSALKSLYLPTGITSIGNNAFAGAASLIQLAIPRTVETIGEGAFAGDGQLFLVVIRDIDFSELAAIEEKAFYGCTSLSQFGTSTSFEFPSSLEEIGQSAFENCSSIKKAYICGKVRTISSAAFMNCKALKTVQMESGVRNIGTDAFRGCSRLKAVSFPDTLNTVGDNAFMDCTTLSKAYLYDVTKIGNSAFRGCDYLSGVTVEFRNAEIGAGAFPNKSTLTLFGYKNSTLSEYQVLQAPNCKFVDINTNQNKDVFKIEKEGSGNGSVVVFTYNKTGTKKIYKKDSAGNILKDDKGNPIQETDDKGNPLTEDVYTRVNIKEGDAVTIGTVLYVERTPANGSVPGEFEVIGGAGEANGVALSYVELPDKSGSFWRFSMPRGGALIFQEFIIAAEANKTKGFANALRATVSEGEFSYDSLGDVTSVDIKVGQSTRMFILDGDDGNRAVDSSIVTFKEISNAGFVKLETSGAQKGTIRGLKTGTAIIVAQVTDAAGKKVEKELHVNVEDAYVSEIKMKAYGANTSNIVYDDEVATVDYAYLRDIEANKNITIKLKAVAYDNYGDNVGCALTWKVSDPKITILSTQTTVAGNSSVTITLPKGCAYGPSTVTASYSYIEKDPVTHKNVTKYINGTYTIYVDNKMPRFRSTKISVNPNKIGGTAAEIIGDYKTIDPETGKIKYPTLELYDATVGDGCTKPISILTANYSVIGSTDDYEVFMITTSSKLAKSYNVNAVINGDTAHPAPLVITVKTGYPQPALSFAKGQKIDLRYVKGTEFNTSTVDTVLKNVSDDEGIEYYLEGLEDKEGNIDTDFTDNFTIDEYTGVVSQNAIELKTVKKKPVVTGNIVMRFPGYVTKDQRGMTIPYEKKVKVTIPTYTSAATYKINANAISVTSGSKKADTIFTIYNKTLNNAPLDMISNEEAVDGASGYYIVNDWKECASVSDITVSGNEIKVTTAANASPARFNLVVRHSKWSSWIPSLKFPITIKTYDKAPTAGISGSLVLNTTIINADDSYAETAIAKIVNKNVPAGYILDEAATATSIEYTKEDEPNIDVSVEEGGVITAKLNDFQKKGSYTYSIVPVYENEYGDTLEVARPIKFNVRVISTACDVTVANKGNVNILMRNLDDLERNTEAQLIEFEKYAKTYCMTLTPKLKNISDSIAECRLYEVDKLGNISAAESDHFVASVINDKIYVYAKPGAEIKSKDTFELKIWVKMKDYSPENNNDGGILVKKTIKIKPTVVYPKVETTQQNLELYLQKYGNGPETAFMVTKTDFSAAGALEDIVFGTSVGEQKDHNSFAISTQKLSDNCVRVIIAAKEYPEYPYNTTFKVRMYAVYENQASDVVGQPFTMNVIIHP